MKFRSLIPCLLLLGCTLSSCANRGNRNLVWMRHQPKLTAHRVRTPARSVDALQRKGVASPKGELGEEIFRERLLEAVLEKGCPTDR